MGVTKGKENEEEKSDVPESQALLLSDMELLKFGLGFPSSPVCQSRGLSWWLGLLNMAHRMDTCVLK